MAKRNFTHYRKHLPSLFTLLTTSFAAICIETISVYLFSIRLGYIYFHVSLLTASLFAGASLSSAAAYFLFKKKGESAAQFLFISDLLVIALILLILFLRSELLVFKAVYYAILAITGLILGGQFSAVTFKVVEKDHLRSDAGYIYAVDLLGAGIFLLVFFRYFPLMGIDAVLYTALLVKTVSAVILLLTGFSADSSITENNISIDEMQKMPVKKSCYHFFIPFVYGISVIITQSLLIRMMLVNVGHSYISFGLPIGIWLIGAALGSFFSAFSRLLKDKISLMIITVCAIIIPLTVFGFLYYGVEFRTVTFNLIFFFSLILFVSFVSGMIFPLICDYFNDKAYVYLTYVVEGAGAVIGGILFAFYNFTFSDFTISIISAMLILILAVLLSFYSKRKIMTIAISIILICYTAIFAVHNRLDTLWMQNQQELRNEKILFYKYTKSGRVEVIYENLNNNMAVYVDRVLQYSLSDDKIHNESMAALSYYFTRAPAEALVIGGGIGGLARELLKFDLRSIDYVEIEPALHEIAKRYFAEALGDIFNEPRLNIVNGDGFKFLNEADTTYDIIILDLPSPSNLQLSRFFTKEFFKMVNDKLNPGGTFMLPLLDSLSFPGEKYLNYSVHNTLNEEFASKRVMLPFYYIPRTANPKKEADFIKKPYFELVICSNDDYINDIEEAFFYNNVKSNENFKKSPLGQWLYVESLFKVSEAYFDKVYSQYDYKGISTLNKMLPLHLKWKYSKEKVNPRVMIEIDSLRNVTIITD